MKTLDFEKMEQTIGGEFGYDYCSTLDYWLTGGSGYQGDGNWLLYCYIKNCYAQI